MIEAPELTIRDYLREVAPSDQADDSLQKRMCRLLSPNLDVGTCDGTAIEMTDMCDIETSNTYTRPALDWAYRQAVQH